MEEEFPPKNCPHCKALLDDGDIYERFLKEYEGDEGKALETAECYGWTKEKPRRFSRAVGYYSMETDRTEFYFCPDCKMKIDWPIRLSDAEKDARRRGKLMQVFED